MPSRRSIPCEKGVSLLVGAISLVFIIPLLGLLVDVGVLYSVKARLQASVDGASLAAARALNLGRSRAVQKVRIALRSAEVKLTLMPRRRMGVDLELWAIEKECDYFREVFGRELATAVS